MQPRCRGWKTQEEHSPADHGAFTAGPQQEIGPLDSTLELAMARAARLLRGDGAAALCKLSEQCRDTQK